MDIKVNLNDSVKVKLSKSGIAELKRQHDSLRAHYPKTFFEFKLSVDDEGYTKFQLHNLMQTLGHLCKIGFDTPFDTEIIFVNK